MWLNTYFHLVRLVFWKKFCVFGRLSFHRIFHNLQCLKKCIKVSDGTDNLILKKGEVKDFKNMDEGTTELTDELNLSSHICRFIADSAQTKYGTTFHCPCVSVCTGVTSQFSQLFDDLGHENHTLSESISSRLATGTTPTTRPPGPPRLA